MLGKAFHLFASFWVVGKVQDTQCGFKGFTRAAALDLFADQKITSIVFDVELIYLARRRGYSIAIVPIRWYDKRGSRMRPGFKLAVRVALGPAAHPAHPPGWSPRTRDQPVPTRSMIGSRPGDRPWLVPVVATALVIVSFFVFLLSARTFDAGRPDLFYLADAFLHGRVTIRHWALGHRSGRRRAGVRPVRAVPVHRHGAARLDHRPAPGGQAGSPSSTR